MKKSLSRKKPKTPRTKVTTKKQMAVMYARLNLCNRRARRNAARVLENTNG